MRRLLLLAALAFATVAHAQTIVPIGPAQTSATSPTVDTACTYPLAIVSTADGRTWYCDPITDTWKIGGASVSGVAGDLQFNASGSQGGASASDWNNTVGSLGIGGNAPTDARLKLYPIGGGSWNPSSISGLAAWYKADSLGATAGDVIGAWSDLSGNNRHLVGKGTTLTGGATATRPVYYAAGGARAPTNLPAVSLEGTTGGGGAIGYFDFPTVLNLTRSPGWTVALIFREWNAGAQTHYYLGNNVSLGDVARSMAWQDSGGTGLLQTFVGGTGTQASSGVAGHAPTTDTHYIVSLKESQANGDDLEAWIDGTVRDPGTTQVADFDFRYLGAYNTNPNWSGMIGVSLSEVIIYNRELTSGEITSLNAYLASRVAGTAGGGASKLLVGTRDDGSEAIRARADGTLEATNFVGGFAGTASRAARLSQDPGDCAANVFATAVDAFGNLTCSNVRRLYNAGGVTHIRLDDTHGTILWGAAAQTGGSTSAVYAEFYALDGSSVGNGLTVFSSTAAHSPFLNLQRARGTGASPAVPQSADALGALNFYSNSGGGYSSWSLNSYLKATATGTHGTNFPTTVAIGAAGATGAATDRIVARAGSNLVDIDPAGDGTPAYTFTEDTPVNGEILVKGTTGIEWQPRTEVYWFAAASCNGASAGPMWDLTAANAPAAACIAGTNTNKAVLDFDAAADEAAQITQALPAGWTGAIDVKVKWLAAATSGSVVWAVQTSCVADAETDDPSWNTASTVTDAAKGVTLQTNDATIAGVTATGCAAGELLHLRLFRDADVGGDDMTGDARLIGAEVTMRRTN